MTRAGPGFRAGPSPIRPYQIVFPERSILIRQKLLENAEIEKLKCDILVDF